MSCTLSNVLPSFQGYINKILVKKLDIFAIIYFDDILIYMKNLDKAHVNAVWWVLEELRKNSLFANLKKCRSQKNKDRFLKYVVSALRVQIKDKRIDVRKN